MLSDYLATERVVTGVRPGEVRDILARLIEPLLRDGSVRDPETVLASLLAREKVLSTGIGYGIAVPHALTSAVEDPAVLLGIAPDGVEFHSVDSEPVFVFFLLLSTPDRAAHHTRLLARIARLGRDPSLVSGLAACRDAAQALRVVAEHERAHP
jgi:mannitol/fructose-specific phosphotransferase system IIA component (Ntr-type)